MDPEKQKVIDVLVQRQLEKAKILHQQDLREGYGAV